MFTRAILGLAALSATATCVVVAAPATSRSTGPAAVSSAPAAPSEAKAMKFPQCLRGFSKDTCNGIMYPGERFIESCDQQECKTEFIQNATLVLDMVRNERLCSEEGKCDECPEKDGSLKLAVNYLVRLNKPCPYRGCIDGKGDLRCVDGSVFTGEFHGTIGVGTHRKFECLEYRTCYCENCVDVELVAPNTWRIGWEGSFTGTRSDAITGETVCFTLSGDFYLDGDSNGVYEFNRVFKSKNTADGIFGTFCE
jgi:hypothetical protein